MPIIGTGEAQIFHLLVVGVKQEAVSIVSWSMHPAKDTISFTKGHSGERGDALKKGEGEV